MKKAVLTIISATLLLTGCMAEYVKNVVVLEDPVSSTHTLQVKNAYNLPDDFLGNTPLYVGFCGNDAVIGIKEGSGLASDIVCVELGSGDMTVNPAPISGAYAGEPNGNGYIITNKPDGELMEIGVVYLPTGEYTRVAAVERSTLANEPLWVDDKTRLTYLIRDGEELSLNVFDVETAQLTVHDAGDMLPAEWAEVQVNLESLKLHHMDEHALVASVAYGGMIYIVVKAEGEPYILTTSGEGVAVKNGLIYHINTLGDLIRFDIASEISYNMQTGVEGFSVSADGGKIAYMTLDELECSRLYIMDTGLETSGLADVRNGVTDFTLSPGGDKLLIEYLDEKFTTSELKYVVRAF